MIFETGYIASLLVRPDAPSIVVWITDGRALRCTCRFKVGEPMQELVRDTACPSHGVDDG